MRIVDFCREKGIKLSFFAIPSGSSWTVKKHNAIVSLSDSLGIDFVDYNTDTDLLDGFDWKTDTKDGGNHMNYYGASKVTSAYTAHLTELFSLTPSELTAEQTAAWDNDTRIFYTDIVKTDKD